MSLRPATGRPGLPEKRGAVWKSRHVSGGDRHTISHWVLKLDGGQQAGGWFRVLEDQRCVKGGRWCSGEGELHPLEPVRLQQDLTRITLLLPYLGEALSCGRPGGLQAYRGISFVLVA